MNRYVFCLRKISRGMSAFEHDLELSMTKEDFQNLPFTDKSYVMIVDSQKRTYISLVNVSENILGS
jgi:hypothetical protein